jgi:predicted secreted acid phosphatase
MRTRAKLALAAVLLLLVAAVPAFAATTPTSKTADEIREYYSSGDWNRAVSKQAKRAKAYVVKRTHGKHKAKKPALVLDIDETSLNNYPCFNASNGIPYDAIVNITCVTAYDAPAIKPVLSLFKVAKANKVKVFFITARPEGIRDGTLKNLRDSGFKGKYELILQPSDYSKESKVPYKSGARKQIRKRGFHIIANVGDQKSDLKGGYSERTYKLPNVIYLTS